MTSDELISSLKGIHNVCYSGGAEGADRLFGEWASRNGFSEIHFSFQKHKYVVPDDTVLELPKEILESPEVLLQLKRANYSLQRSIPKKGTYVYNLLARNSFQIKLTQRVYCISSLVSPTQVDGGTAWAVQMYIDSYANPEIYCYDPIRKVVFMYNTVLKEFEEVQSVPMPHGDWTGIGSRKSTQQDMDNFEKYFR